MHGLAMRTGGTRGQGTPTGSCDAGDGAGRAVDPSLNGKLYIRELRSKLQLGYRPRARPEPGGRRRAGERPCRDRRSRSAWARARHPGSALPAVGLTQEIGDLGAGRPPRRDRGRRRLRRARGASHRHQPESRPPRCPGAVQAPCDGARRRPHVGGCRHRAHAGPIGPAIRAAGLRERSGRGPGRPSARPRPERAHSPLRGLPRPSGALEAGPNE